MSDSLILYHNPRCSKSRAALAWLEEHCTVPVEVVDYRKQPPSEAELAHILQLLGFDDARRMMRQKDALFGELGLADPASGNAGLIAAMHRHPELIERPLAVYRNRAAIGRPLENIIALLD